MPRPSRHRLTAPAAHATCRIVTAAVITAVVTAVLVATTAEAAWAIGADEPTQQLEEVLDNARDWLVGILGAVALVLLTIAGIRYSLGAASPTETEKAKTGITAVLIGLAIAFLAPTIVGILRGILGV